MEIYRKSKRIHDEQYPLCPSHYVDLRTRTEWEFLILICEGDLFALMPLLFIPLARPGDSTLSLPLLP